MLHSWARILLGLRFISQVIYDVILRKNIGTIVFFLNVSFFFALEFRDTTFRPTQWHGLNNGFFQKTLGGSAAGFFEKRIGEARHSEYRHLVENSPVLANDIIPGLGCAQIYTMAAGVVDIYDMHPRRLTAGT